MLPVKLSQSDCVEWDVIPSTKYLRHRVDYRTRPRYYSLIIALSRFCDTRVRRSSTFHGLEPWMLFFVCEIIRYLPYAAGEL